MNQIKQKYIRTYENEIIVFPDLLEHKEFTQFNPISAGFVFIDTDEQNKPTIECYGQSYSLGLKSRLAEDSALARRQILGEL